MPKILVSARCMRLLKRYADEHGHDMRIPPAQPSGEYEIDLAQDTIDRVEPYRKPGRPLTETLEELLILSWDLPEQ